MMQAPVQLRELVISGCHKFHRLPNSIGCLKELKKIVITGYANDVRSLPEEICRLQLLEHLELVSCGMLSSLPSSFGDLISLQYLVLSGCSNLRGLPFSFKKLMLLQYLNLRWCQELILMPDDFQNITKLEYLSLYECKQLEELPRHITNQAALRELDLDGVVRLRELPINIGQLSKLRKMSIRGHSLVSLPNSIGDLSSLTYLSIHYCSNLESLPTSLGDLFTLTMLSIGGCPKLKCLPSSVGRLNLLEHLTIEWCPISQVDFASSSFALSNLKRITLINTEVCRISISEDRYPRLENLFLMNNNHLTEIEALPANLECLALQRCPKLDELPSIARLTSLKDLVVVDCDRIKKIEGLKYCTRLEFLHLKVCWEVPGIESLEQMEKLRTVKLRANKGSTIECCIQTIQKWPNETIICTRAVPEACSVVDSLILSPNFSAFDSFSNKDIFSEPGLLQKHSSDGNAIMLCYIINSVCLRQVTIDLRNSIPRGIQIAEIEEGRWVMIVVFTQPSKWLAADGPITIKDFSAKKGEVEVERGLGVRGEHKELVVTLSALLQSI